jgi:kynureninase
MAEAYHGAIRVPAAAFAKQLQSPPRLMSDSIRPMLALQHLFSRALAAAPLRVHLAAHSHHLWPDTSFDGHMQAWHDAASLADQKWDKIFGDIWPRAQAHIALELGTGQPQSVAFSPNTHDFVVRLLSCFPTDRPVRVLTTDAEFHSFSRQLDRMLETGRVIATRVAAEPFDTLEARVLSELARAQFDLVFISHVLFNSGALSCSPARVAAALHDQETLLVFDGYHSFMARPIDFGPVASRAFFLGGGYKYAMAGEGVCFMHAPPGYVARPELTGWFAAFGALARPQGGVSYPEHAGRFLGSTFDPSGLYRFVNVMDMLAREGVTSTILREHARTLSDVFLGALGNATQLQQRDLVLASADERRGQFLTFDFAEAAAVQAKLQAQSIITDVRGSRLRISFGLYHGREDAIYAAKRITQVLA